MATPTTKQKIATQKAIANGGNVSKAMVEAGYSPATAHTPQKLTESDGYKLILEEHGLTDKLLIDALVADIAAKPQNRARELELGFKLLNRLKESSPMVNNYIAVILERYGLTDARQTSATQGGLPQDTA